MTDGGTNAWTTLQVDMTYQRIHALQTGFRASPRDHETTRCLVVCASVLQQYCALLSDLRSAGLQIARWHDLTLDARGNASEHQLRDSLDVLTKLVEDKTDTRMPTGSPG